MRPTSWRCSPEEVSARNSHSGEVRMTAAHLAGLKTIDDCDFRVQTSVKRTSIAHLAQLDSLAEAVNVVFLGPPVPARPISSIALAVQAARRAAAWPGPPRTQWVKRLRAAKRTGRIDEEIKRLGRISLLVVDEVGYIPFDPQTASLVFALISSRYQPCLFGLYEWQDRPERPRNPMQFSFMITSPLGASLWHRE
jgi:DNA replication protein DnaC